MPTPGSSPDLPAEPATPKRQLTLFDSTCIIVGIIIGAGIYETAPRVARGAGWWWDAIGLGFLPVAEEAALWGAVVLFWLAGGLLSLCGAFGYAELATAYPKEGGDYVYLGRAYGRWAGFLFGWMQLAIVRPGDIVGMAFVFATYAEQIYNPLAETGFAFTGQLYAATAVALLTAVNVWGIRQGKWTQNLLTVFKASGLLAIVAVALFAPRGEPSAAEPSPFPISVALILVLFTYGGWNEMAYVAAEVKRPKRNIVRALVLGTVAVTLLYLLVNAAFLYALGYAGLATSDAVAADAVATVFPEVGARLISAVVCISALGVVNGLIFTGARISYAVGAEHRAFRVLGKWDRQRGTPARALLLQGALAVGLVVVLGSFLDAILYTAAAIYLFYLATSLAVIVLRFKEPHVERPYRVTGYPLTTLVFAGVCAFLIYGSIMYKPLLSAVALGIIFLGLPIYWLTGGSRGLSDR